MYIYLCVNVTYVYIHRSSIIIAFIQYVPYREKVFMGETFVKVLLQVRPYRETFPLYPPSS